jgi:hypothetical protein
VKDELKVELDDERDRLRRANEALAGRWWCA